MQIPKLSALFETSLASALSAAGTSFSVVSGTDRDGNALSGLYGFIIDEGSADEEFVVGTVSGTTVTVVYRGCDAESPATEVSANKKTHRRGASVKITDYPVLAFVRNALAGETGYELHAFLKMVSTAGLPTDDKHLTTKEYVDDAVSAGTGIPNKIIVAGNAGETVAAGQLVYFDDTDNEWKLCDADTAATVENTFLGIAQGAGVDGGAITNGVLIFGVDTNQSGLTNGAPYYASNTAGALSSSPGTKEVTIGFGRPTANELNFCPRFNQQLTEDQQDALVGTSGTPSGSNKFVTNDDATTSVAASKILRLNGSGLIARLFLTNSYLHYVSASDTTLSDTNETTAFTRAISSGELIASSGLRVKFAATVNNSSGASRTLTIRVKYGGSTVATLTYDGGNASGDLLGEADILLSSLSTQVVFTKLFHSMLSPFVTQDYATAAVDMSSAANLTLTAQASSVTNFNVTIKAISIEVLK